MLLRPALGLTVRVMQPRARKRTSFVIPVPLAIQRELRRHFAQLVLRGGGRARRHCWTHAPMHRGVVGGDTCWEGRRCALGADLACVLLNVCSCFSASVDACSAWGRVCCSIPLRRGWRPPAQRYQAWRRSGAARSSAACLGHNSGAAVLRARVRQRGGLSGAAGAPHSARGSSVLTRYGCVASRGRGRSALRTTFSAALGRQSAPIAAATTRRLQRRGLSLRRRDVRGQELWGVHALGRAALETSRSNLRVRQGPLHACRGCKKRVT